MKGTFLHRPVILPVIRGQACIMTADASHISIMLADASQAFVIAADMRQICNI
jgi:hypothetical protein